MLGQMFTMTAKAAMNRNLDLLIRSVIVPQLAIATRDATALVLADATRLVPVDTGELRNSGQANVEEQRASVVGIVAFTAEHAGFIEFGTGLRGRGTYPGRLPQTGVPITGSWIYDYKSQNWVGMVAKPYLRPALDANRDLILAIFRRLMDAIR